MRRMLENKLINWIKSLFEHIAQSGNTTEVGGNLEVDGDLQVNDQLKLGESGSIDANLSNAIYGSLVGHFVRIMQAPDSTTLTDEQIAEIIDGRFINGNFLSFENPILLPAHEDNDAYIGVIIGQLGSQSQITMYSINKANKVISSPAPESLKLIALKNIAYINGKAFPNFPASTGTFTPKCVNGVLTWVED